MVILHSYCIMEDYILRLINQTNRSFFLTGKAGTGKTTLLHKIMATTYKNTVVVAPTGIAALNAGGVTIHSLFQLPFASFLPTYSSPPIVNEYIRFENRVSLRKHFQMHKHKQQVIKNMELLIIDEVSMLRADVLDAMDYMLQYIRRNNDPFGGVQVVFIGDLLQLPPVVKQEEWEVLRQYYKGVFFFHSRVISNHPLLYVELDKIYRQTDGVFISILNHLRDNALTAEDIRLLESYVRPNFSKEHRKDYITLTTHNAKADAMNMAEIEKLETSSFSYEAEVEGDFPEYLYPIDRVIKLKEGARVMFIKNDISGDHLFFNGKMGTVVFLSTEEVRVVLDGGEEIGVDRYEWKNVRYRVNEITKDIEEEVLGTFVQYPLRLAWAITIHKSQGLTFEKAVLDLNSVFASGQAYVAFSRLRSLEGLVLLSSINREGIENDEEVMGYATNRASEEEIAKACNEGGLVFLRGMILKVFEWDHFLKGWYLHCNGYSGEIGSKNYYRDWAFKQYKRVEEMVKVAEKFRKQLQEYFDNRVAIETVFERIKKGVNYFVPLFEDIWYELFYTEYKIAGQKKVKEFSKELRELNDTLTEVLKKILQIEQIVMLLEAHRPLNKENIQSERLQWIRDKVLHKVGDVLKSEQLFVEQGTERKTLSKKNKGGKQEKVSTYDITLQLWQQNKTVSEIAKERMLTEGTIYGHLCKLIEKGALDKEVIEAIFSNEDIKELQRVFEMEEDLTTTKGIYEKCNGKYDYGQLRLFKVCFLKRN